VGEGDRIFGTRGCGRRWCGGRNGFVGLRFGFLLWRNGRVVGPIYESQFPDYLREFLERREERTTYPAFIAAPIIRKLE